MTPVYLLNLNAAESVDTDSECRVGGVVSETSFKFFIQFLFYAMLFVTFNGVVMAVFVAERKKMVNIYTFDFYRVVYGD